jgi:hypothetical protein
MARTLCKKSKIGTFADFLDLHLADSIPRVLPEIETAILVISNSLALNREFKFGNALDRSLILVMLLIKSSILERTLYHSLLLSITL